MAVEMNFRQEYRITAIIASAIMASLLAYGTIVTAFQMQSQDFSGFSQESVNRYRDGVLLAVLVLLVGINVSRKALLKKGPGDTPKTLLNKLRMATIITFALCEIPALLGLVMFFLGGSTKDFYTLALVSLAFMVLYFPRYRHWVAWVGGSSGIY